MAGQRTIRLAIHIPSRRPLCALLQAVAAGDHVNVGLIDGRHWLTAPPSGEIAIVTGTREEWTMLNAWLAAKEAA